MDGEYTDDLPRQAHRNGNRPLQPDPSRDRQRLAAVVDEVELEHLFGPHHPLCGHVPALAHRGQLAPGRGANDDVGELRPPRRFAQVQGGIGDLEDLGGGMRHRSQQVVGSDRDGSQSLRDLLQRDDRLVESARLEFGLLAQVGVLDHQRHLGGDRLQQLDILLGQRVTRGQARDEVSRVALAAHQGHHQGSLDTAELGEEPEAASGIGGELVDDFDPYRRLVCKAFRELQGTQPGELPCGLADRPNHGAHFEAVRLIAGE